MLLTLEVQFHEGTFGHLYTCSGDWEEGVLIRVAYIFSILCFKMVTGATYWEHHLGTAHEYCGWFTTLYATSVPGSDCITNKSSPVFLYLALGVDFYNLLLLQSFK